MPRVSITVIQQFFTDLHQKLPVISAAFSDSVFEVLELVKEATNDLTEISKCDEVRRVNEVKVSYQHLKYTIEAVYTYLDKVDDLYWKLQGKISAVILDVEQEGFKSVVKLIVEINKTIQDCKVQCAILHDRCKEFASSCGRAERECRRLAREAEDNRTTTQVVGGVTTAVVGAGGIAASVLVGVFTFGVGFAVGLPIAIGATVATTTAGAVTTAVLASQYGEAAEAFKKLGRRFQSLQRNINTTQDTIDKIMRLPGINVEFTEHIKITITTKAESLSLLRTLRITLSESIRLYAKTSIGRSTTKEYKESFHGKYDKTF